MQGLTVGRVLGIPIRLHWSFLVVLPVFAGLIGLEISVIVELLNQLLGGDIDAEPLGTGVTPFVLGLVAAVGLFVGVLLHEFGHSIVAIRFGYEIDSITLWLLGGLANFVEMPEDWRHELWIAIAGPAVSVVVGLVCYVGFALSPADFDHPRFVLGYLAILNLLLAAFNLLPAFPMDGGRVLRALLARTRSHADATELAADVGKVFAVFMALVGLLGLNVILLVLGLFIYIAATSEAKQTTMKAAFEDVAVADLMTGRADLHVVSPETSVAELVGRMFYEGHTGYPVVRDGSVVGIVTLEDARAVNEVEREAFTVADVMSTDIITIGPDANAFDALERVLGEDIGRLPVVDEDDELVGIISRSDLTRALQVVKAGGSQLVGDTESTAGGEFE